jgi:hypothetical protein
MVTSRLWKGGGREQRRPRARPAARDGERSTHRGKRTRSSDPLAGGRERHLPPEIKSPGCHFPHRFCVRLMVAGAVEQAKRRQGTKRFTAQRTPGEERYIAVGYIHRNHSE